MEYPMADLSRRTFLWSTTAAAALFAAAPAEPWKILIVVAHPDDEYYFAATVYRLAQELNATVDQVVITNGEGGFRYSTLAERYYGVALTDEKTGRSRLPEIRKKETLAAGRILGIRHHHFLDQHDNRFSLDVGEAMDHVWNHEHIRKSLVGILRHERYDFIFTVLPRASTHGHHQAATLLAIEASKQVSPGLRPVILGAEPGRLRDSIEYSGLAAFPETHATSDGPAFVFERMRSFGYQGALRYDIVVNWVISEHKSQGMFQNDVAKHDVERFWVLGEAADGTVEKVSRLAHELAGATNRKVAQQ